MDQLLISHYLYPKHERRWEQDRIRGSCGSLLVMLDLLRTNNKSIPVQSSIHEYVRPINHAKTGQAVIFILFFRFLKCSCNFLHYNEYAPTVSNYYVPPLVLDGCKSFVEEEIGQNSMFISDNYGHSDFYDDAIDVELCDSHLLGSSFFQLVAVAVTVYSPCLKIRSRLPATMTY